MKIKISKDNSWLNDLYKSDKRRIREYGYEGVSITPPTVYNGDWEEVEVTSFEEIQEYVNNGYSIKINC